MKANHQKKIAMINDLSGYGRCSLTVAIPILSAMRIQCCPVPTSILSNHTGFPVWFFDDYTEKMERYLEKWKELSLSFDGIATGFLGSEEQVRIVRDMIVCFRKKETKVIVDPVMGDNGRAYHTCTPKLCQEMEKLVRMADVVTPNLTEACILTGKEYKSYRWKQNELFSLAEDIQKLGPKTVVITGVESPPKEGKAGSLTNVILEENGRVSFLQNQKSGKGRPGTGDMFSAVVAGAVVQEADIKDGVRLAAGFVKSCIKKSDELEVPRENGVCFEELLPEFILMCRRLTGDKISIIKNKK